MFFLLITGKISVMQVRTPRPGGVRMRPGSQPRYSFGTHAPMDAGTVFPEGVEAAFHQPKLRLQV